MTKIQVRPEPMGDTVVIVGLKARPTHVEARLQNWRLLRPGDEYFICEQGVLRKATKRFRS